MSSPEGRKLPHTGSEAGPLRPKLVVIALLSIGIGAALFLLQRETLPLPDVDLSRLEPRLAARIRELQEEIQDHPRSSERWGELGMVLHAHGMTAEAARAYERAIELEPSAFRWHYLLAHADRELGAQTALEEVNRALAIDPTYAPALVLKSEILESRGDVEEAEKVFEAASEIDREALRNLWQGEGEGNRELDPLYLPVMR